MITKLNQFLNKYICPICKSNIDLLYLNDTKYSCALNPSHYNIYITLDDEKNPFVLLERISIYYERVLYSVTKRYSLRNLPTQTEIFIVKVDSEKRVHYSHNEKIFIFDGDLDFSNFDQSKFVNKIKTILMFS